MKLIRLAAIPAIVLLCQCGTPSPPACHVVPRASRGAPSVFIGQARQAWHGMQTGSGAEREQARRSYNDAVAKLFDQLHCGGGSIQEQAAAMGTTIDAGCRTSSLAGFHP